MIRSAVFLKSSKVEINSDLFDTIRGSDVMSLTKYISLYSKLCSMCICIIGSSQCPSQNRHLLYSRWSRMCNILTCSLTINGHLLYSKLYCVCIIIMGSLIMSLTKQTSTLHQITLYIYYHNGFCHYVSHKTDVNLTPNCGWHQLTVYAYYHNMFCHNVPRKTDIFSTLNYVVSILS